MNSDMDSDFEVRRKKKKMRREKHDVVAPSTEEKIAATASTARYRLCVGPVLVRERINTQPHTHNHAEDHLLTQSTHIQTMCIHTVSPNWAPSRSYNYCLRCVGDGTVFAQSSTVFGSAR